MSKTVNIVHILVGIIFIALLKYFNDTSVSFIEKWKYVWLVMGLMIFGYHLEHFIKSKHWIYAWHAFFVAPVIMSLGFYTKTSIPMFKFVAISMIGYHLAILTKIL
jgi:hypothetical protein